MKSNRAIKRRAGSLIGLAALVLAAGLCSCAFATSGTVPAASAAPASASSVPAAAATPKPAPTTAPAGENGAAGEQSASSAALFSADAVRADILAQADSSLYFSWTTWEDWDKVDQTALNVWTDALGMDQTPDPKYPGLTMDALQGTWYNRENDIKITISGNICTLTYPAMDYNEKVVPCVLLNRSTEKKCPSLLLMTYPQFPEDMYQGFALYINKMTDTAKFETTDWGTFEKQ